MSVAELPATYEAAIRWIVSLCPAPDKFAHTYAGLGLWLLTAMLARWPLRSLRPLAAVAVAEIANEIMDRFAHGSWEWSDTLKDAAATWFWPIVLMLALRFVPVLTAQSEAKPRCS